jgi:hypothetical protein
MDIAAETYGTHSTVPTAWLTVVDDLTLDNSLIVVLIPANGPALTVSLPALPTLPGFSLPFDIPCPLPTRLANAIRDVDQF